MVADRYRIDKQSVFQIAKSKSFTRFIEQLMERAHGRVTEGADSDASLQEFRFGLIHIGVTSATATKFADTFFKELRKGRSPIRRWFNEFLAVFKNQG